MKRKQLCIGIGLLIIAVTLCACEKKEVYEKREEIQKELSENDVQEEKIETPTVYIEEPKTVTYIYEDDEIKLCEYGKLKVHIPDTSNYEVPQDIIDEQLNILIDGTEELKNIKYDGTDEWFSQNMGIQKAELEKQLMEDAKNAYPSQMESQTKNELITYIYNHSQFTPSKERCEAITLRLKHECEEAAKEYEWEDMEQMLYYRYGYPSWDDYINSEEGQEAVRVNAEMDVLFDTLWTITGYKDIYNTEVLAINERIIQYPENVDYEEITAQKQQIQSILTNFIYEIAIIENDEGEVQK